ncbi:MAG TPA: protein kinase [Thermoanaerobaculia bacterium]|nr:protein kinase [Thermoanaerobaculia bacterium]
MALPGGTRLGPYEILSPLGAGGMGEVYRARDERLKRDVAIKVLPSSYSGDPDRLKRFELEAQAAGGLNHPNITAVYDVGQYEGAPYVVQELLEGETLRAELAGGRLGPRKALDYALQIAEGLAAAHEKGIVHRDLKPENLFVTREGRVKILDFGLAKLVHPERNRAEETSAPTAAATEPGTIMGTAGYMSPEQVKGQPVDHRSDIFSFGSILFEMLSGRRPFVGDTEVETMSAILKEDPPELLQTARILPAGLERVVRHCLEKSPGRRFQSARDLAFDLTSISEVTVPSRPAAGTLSAGRRYAVPLAGAAAALILLAGGVLGERWIAARRARMTTPSFHRLTFRRGNVLSARFAPDGQTVVYGAAWDGRSSELFTVRADSVESRPLDIHEADIASVSGRGDLAIVLRKGSFLYALRPGMLASVPLGGGAPRELQEDVITARWAPDGEALAVIRRSPTGKYRLEYPIGRTLLESFLLHRYLAMAPNGLLAFSEASADGRSTIFVVDAAGQPRELTGGWLNLSGLAWSSRTGELVFFAGRTPYDSSLWAIRRSGSLRLLWPAAMGEFVLHDVSADGRILLEHSSLRTGVIWLASGAAQERELGWLDRNPLRDLSRDGSEILFAEAGEAAGLRGGIYVRKTDGSPAVRLGDGDPLALSPDGRWALAKTRSDPPGIVLLPIGPGSPRKVSLGGISPLSAAFLGDEKHIGVVGARPGGPPQVSAVELDGSRTRSIPTPEASASFGYAFSRAGSFLAYAGEDRKIRIVAVAGGSAPRALTGEELTPGEEITGWTGDDRYVLSQTREIPARVFRNDARTGERTLWKEIQPADRAGLIDVGAAYFTRDGSGYAYSDSRIVSSDIYLVEGLM